MQPPTWARSLPVRLLSAVAVLKGVAGIAVAPPGRQPSHTAGHSSKHRESHVPKKGARAVIGNDVGTFAYLHPVVEQAMSRMPDRVDALRAQVDLVGAEQDKLERLAADSVAHATEGTKLLHEIHKQEAEVHTQVSKINILKKREIQMSGRRNDLIRALHLKMDSGVRASEGRALTSRKGANVTEGTVRAWSQRREKELSATQSKLRTRSKKLRELHDAEVALNAAERARDEAARSYNIAKRVAGEQVEMYRHVEAHYKAATSQADAARKKSLRDAMSYGKLKDDLAHEEHRIGGSTSHAISALRAHLHQAGETHGRALQKLADLRKRYAAWNSAQQRLARQQAEQKMRYEDAVKAYVGQQRMLYGDAAARAADNVMKASGFDADDWAWSGDGGDLGSTQQTLDLVPPRGLEPTRASLLGGGRWATEGAASGAQQAPRANVSDPWVLDLAPAEAVFLPPLGFSEQPQSLGNALLSAASSGPVLDSRSPLVLNVGI